MPVTMPFTVWMIIRSSGIAWKNWPIASTLTPPDTA